MVKQYRLAVGSILWFACSLLPVAVHAQAETGGLASAAVSGTFGGESAEVAVTGALGYRVTPTLSIAFELTALPGLTARLPKTPDVIIADAIPLIYPSPFPQYSADGGHATFVTGNLRLEVPARGRWRPFVVAGAGVGSVVERIRARIDYRVIPAVLEASDLPLRMVFSQLPLISLPRIDEVYTESSTAFATTFGGGLGIPLGTALSVDVDIRYLALLGRRDLHLVRVGAGLTARF